MEKQLEQFREYLRSRGYRPSTVSSYCNEAKRFCEWLQKEGLKLDQVSYGDMLKWIGWQQGQGQKAKTINQALGSIRHLYASCELVCPVAELRLRGQRHKVVAETLSMEELTTMYASYGPGGLVGKRNKAMAGVLIWQGVKRIELQSLRLEDVDLDRALIRVPSTASTNERVLPIDGQQMLALQDYIQLVRPALLELYPGEHLFFSAGSGKRLSNSLSYLIKQLRSYNYRLKSANQIRQSLITHWLNHHDVRTVQYMAGHRYLSSTSRYQVRKLEDLQERIESLHPLNSGSSFFN